MNLKASLKKNPPSQGAILLISLCLSWSFAAQAAPNRVDGMLNRPTNEIHRQIEVSNKGAYQELRNYAFDSKRPFAKRWKALVSMAWMGQTRSVPDLELALQSKDWFMRDAGLRCLAKINGRAAKKWGRRLLADKALVVRTTAVQTLHELNDKEALPLLWGRLQASENFRRGKSLWVRKHIVNALDEMTSKREAPRFVELLNDTDPQIRVLAQGILQRKSGKSFATREQWQAWARKSATL